MPNKSKIAAIVSWLAGIVTGLIALVFPLGYLFTSYQHLTGEVETEVRLIANSITQEVISNNPELWQFGQARLEEYLASSRHYSQTETRRVLNDKNELIAAITGSQVRPPLLRRSYPLADSGVVVGSVEISLSLRPVLEKTGLIALLALAAGAGAFMILRILPIRAIRRMEEALQKANDELELKVLERTAKLDEANRESQRRGKLVEKLNNTLIDLAQDNRIYGGDNDVVFRTITEASALALATERVSIWFYSESNDAITCMDLYEAGSGKHSKGARLEASAYPAYFRTLNEEYIIAADDAVTDLRTMEFAESYLKPLGITSMLDVPIRLRGRVIGVVCHEHVGPPRKWSVEEQNFITAITGFTSLALEIFERKKTEDELRLSRSRFQNLVETTSDIVWEMNEEGRYTFASDRFFDVLGYKPEEIYGKSPLELMPPDEAKRFAGIISEYAASPKPFSFLENVSLDKHGNRVFLESCGVPIYHADGSFHGYSGIDRNITERKLAEEEIRRLNSELEQRVARRTRQLIEAQEELVRKEKLAILGQLSGSVGHELRNPLGVMSNAVYFLKMITADTDETTREYLDIIKHEIDNSLRIITDLLDFARTRTPQTKTVAVQELVHRCLAASVIPGSVDLQTDLPDTLPLLRIDPLQMEQVFQNLITNAVQALPDGGTVRISAQLVTDAATGGDFVAVSIEDTGEGITPENMKKLFQPLFTTKAKGIGLGLVICRSLTEANGGRIEAKTEFGIGTTFTVYLPTGA